MVFSSLLFLFVFLPIVLLIYFIAPKSLRNLVLFVMSLLFYAWGEPIYIVIMIFSTLVDYTHGLLVSWYKKKGAIKKAKLVLLSAMVINLSLLIFFKYSDFIISNINGIFSMNIPLLNLVLPIGISFYTFQTMSYTIDVYRGKAEAQRNIISFGAYVAFFPQLIAGPIVQYKTIAAQLNHRKENVEEFSYGVQRFMLGLGKKVLLANNIGYLWNQINVMDVTTIPTLTAWIGITAFAFQIYFDFSGYSDMAIGLGHMFGFCFLENFNYPYMSKSITEFWRRWHISLGTWFKEYVYITLGGNKKGFTKQIRNIIVVWLLTGIWHGASWNFVIWGVYFGVLLIIEKLVLLKRLQKSPAFISHIYTLVLVLFSWVIFAFDDFSKVILYFKAMLGFNGTGFINSESIYLLYTNLLLLIILIIASTDLPKKLVEKLFLRIEHHKFAIQCVKNLVFISIFILSISYLVDASFNPFLYFRF
jgi:alginate O-acetyltransferase complex protein AlgI